jgi:hypothetical protein
MYKIKIIQSINSVETGVPGEKPLQAKLRADYFSNFSLPTMSMGVVF